MDQVRIKTEFFRDHPMTVDFFSKWQSQHPWNEGYFPIYQWQNVLFITCSDSVWRQMEATGGPQIPAQLTSSHQICWLLCEDAVLHSVWQNLQNLLVAAAPKPPTEAPLELLDTPEISTESRLSDVDSSTGPEMPEGLSLTPDLTFAAPKLAQKNANLDLGNLGSPPDPGVTPATAPVTQIPDFFDMLNPHFARSMILIIKNEVAEPWKWNAGLQPATSPLFNVDLKVQSPFYVAYRTRKSYHGPAPKSEFMTRFYQFWNRGVEFPCLNIVPLFKDDKLFGFLMAEGEVSEIQLDKLDVLEKFARELELTLSSQSQVVAA